MNNSLATPLEPTIAHSDASGEAQESSSWAGPLGRVVKHMGATLARLTSRSSTDSPTHGSYAAVAADDGTVDVERGVAADSSSTGPLSASTDDDTQSTDNQQPGITKSGSLGRIASTEQGGGPVCLICLEPLTTEDYDKGEAIQLQCKCRGDLAMRHKTCAARWAGHKGDNVCDICKEPIQNLPEPIVPERDSDDEEGAGIMGMPVGIHALEPPTSVDMVFDCIRVMWVAMIVCILFFEMNLSNALWTGVVIGLSYTVFIRLMWRSQLALAQAHLASAQPQLVMVNGDGRVVQPTNGQVNLL